MCPRRVFWLVLAATVLAGGWIARPRPAARPDPAVPAVAALGPARAERESAGREPLRIVEFFQPAPSVPGAEPVDLPAEAAAVTAEAVALQLLASDSELELSPRQWAALAAVTLDIQAVRQAYEASIATASTLAPGRYRLEIPVYASAGDALRERFHSALRTELGEANATEILARLGAKFEGHFGGFGVSAQTLDVAGDPRGAGAVCEVTRTVKFWNSVEGQDRLTTRRETHFPGLEGASGEAWGPLLSVLSDRIATPAGS